ncbi:MAG: hypothetical protein LIV11_01650 [Bacillota bacterium]|nr:hypothetical protein [Bacillota bacterium]
MRKRRTAEKKIYGKEELPKEELLKGRAAEEKIHPKGQGEKNENKHEMAPAPCIAGALIRGTCCGNGLQFRSGEGNCSGWGRFRRL